MTADEAKRLMSKHGSQRKAAAAAGVSRKVIRNALARQARARPHDARVIRGRTLSEFRHAYDKNTIIPARVNAALKALGAGWLYEVEFAKQAGLSLADLGLYRDKYAAHFVSLREGRRVWFGRAAHAEEARRML